jgi:osmotically-inducible protein OsmY
MDKCLGKIPHGTSSLLTDSPLLRNKPREINAMKIANRLIVASSLLIAAGCAHHDRQANTNEYSPTYGAVGTSGTGAYSSPTDRYSSADRSGRYSSPNQTDSSTSFNSQTDSTLTSQVQQSIKNDTSLAGFSSGIMVNAQNGTITLTGSVPSEQDKQKVESMVKNTTGVVSVNNQLQVSLRPTSERQDQSSRIYHDSKDQGAATPSDTSINRPTATDTSPSAGTSSFESSKPQSPTPDSGKNDLTSKSDPTSTPSTDSSKLGVTGTPSSTDLAASSPNSQPSTPSTPTSERPSTRVYSGQQKDPSATGIATDATSADTLSFNVQGTTDADKSIGRQVMQELRSDATLGAMFSQIKINVDSGKVTLKGNVKSEEQKKNAESIAQKVTGVSTIDNQITVGADATGTESK